jgi:hypothetical protein
VNQTELKCRICSRVFSLSVIFCKLTKTAELRRGSLGVILCGLASLSVTSRLEASEIYEFYSGVRQLGMGGAYTAVVNDETAVLSNPAGLGKIRDITVTFADPEIHGTMKFTEIANLGNLSALFDIQGLLDVLNASRGKHWHAKFQAFPSFVAPNFGIGLHAKYSYDAEVDSAGTVYRLDYVNDTAAALGYCFRFFGGVVKLGTGFRLINRVEVHKDLDPTATGLALSNTASEGMGAAADVGLILTAPVAGLPAFAAVLRDAGGTAYNLSDGIFLSATPQRPAWTPQRLDVGLALQPILANNIRMSLTVDVHDVLTLSEETEQMRRLHAGTELNFHDFFFLRLGSNQSYLTAGFELASERFQIQGATYGEEIGSAGSGREDRRWVGKFSLRF